MEKKKIKELKKGSLIFINNIATRILSVKSIIEDDIIMNHHIIIDGITLNFCDKIDNCIQLKSLEKSAFIFLDKIYSTFKLNEEDFKLRLKILEVSKLIRSQSKDLYCIQNELDKETNVLKMLKSDLSRKRTRIEILEKKKSEININIDQLKNKIKELEEMVQN